MTLILHSTQELGQTSGEDSSHPIWFFHSSPTPNSRQSWQFNAIAQHCHYITNHLVLSKSIRLFFFFRGEENSSCPSVSHLFASHEFLFTYISKGYFWSLSTWETKNVTVVYFISGCCVGAGLPVSHFTSCVFNVVFCELSVWVGQSVCDTGVSCVHCFNNELLTIITRLTTCECMCVGSC